MKNIRQATRADLSRIAEILIFNYRLNFYPIFQDDEFYFQELQVANRMEEFKELIDHIWIYDDGAVKGFLQLENKEVKKLFVEPVLQGKSIGADLLKYAIDEHGANNLWALEKNVRAIDFYRRHGFRLTEEKKYEEGTTEYLVRLQRNEF